MKKSALKSIIAVAALAVSAAASAEVQVHLTEQFASGAEFDGVLTFTDGFQALSGVTGVLSGASYGTNPIGWTWRLGGFGTTAGLDGDGNAATFEDWLMSGPVQTGDPTQYNPFIGISWTPSTNGTLLLTLNADGFHTGVTSAAGTDLAVSYSVTAVPEPETYAMLLGGLGMLAVAARRRQKTA